MRGLATMTANPGGARQGRAATVALIAAVLLFTSAVAQLFLRHRAMPGSVPTSVASLVQLGWPEGTRTVEPRLSGGFPWAPFHQPAVSEQAPPPQSALRGASGTERHFAGVLELVQGDSRNALDALEGAAEKSTEPSAWNDLSAALHETALRYGSPELLAKALAAADRALSFNADYSEALFNRALILEHLGLRDDAREAWRRSISKEPDAQWAAEARKHLEGLAPVRPLIEVLDEEYDAVAASLPLATELVRLDPFNARAAGVKVVLGRWGEAVQRGDAAEADRHLRVARTLGAALAAENGEQMLSQAVAAIDRADDAHRSMLAAGHVDYRAGTQTFTDRRPVNGGKFLRRAEAEFAQGGSPMSLAAAFLIANTLYEEGDHDEGQREVERLLALTSSDFPGYRALMLMQLGLSHIGKAEWGPAIATLESAEAACERLGEAVNAAETRRRLSIVYDHVDDRATAWKYRIASLRASGQRTEKWLGEQMSAIADAAILRKEWRIAASFLDLRVEMCRRLRDDVSLADTLLVRAVVRDRQNDRAGAAADIDAAREAAGRAVDPAYRAYLRAGELRATAMLTATPPRDAEALFTQAIEFQKSNPVDLPGLFLERARARRSLGDIAGALSDVQRGIDDLEQYRESLPEGAERWGAFHAAEELFDDAVDLSVAAGAVKDAFLFSERGRARALLDSYGRMPFLDYRRLPSSTVIVEYVALPSRLIIFTADVTGVHEKIVDCEREKLVTETKRFNKAIREDEDIAPATAALYTRVIEPVISRLAAAHTLVFVPDATTSTVAFSALAGTDGEYLVENHAVVIAPSAAAYAATAERGAERGPLRSALVLASSQAGADVGALGSVKMEARLVAATYASPQKFEDDAAGLEQLRTWAPSVDVIHFAGHGIGDDRAIEPASIVLREDGHERRVGAAEIAKLRLRRAAVVVLAGCSTARGERRAAEGVISVAHGFLLAGASSVLATQWPISDDVAPRFFVRLHQLLVQGSTPAEALRSVQREAIRRGDPISMWAAVQDIGS